MSLAPFSPWPAENATRKEVEAWYAANVGDARAKRKKHRAWKRALRKKAARKAKKA